MLRQAIPAMVVATLMTASLAACGNKPPEEADMKAAVQSRLTGELDDVTLMEFVKDKPAKVQKPEIRNSPGAHRQETT